MIAPLAIRARVVHRVEATFGDSEPSGRLAAFAEPKGDAGWFGPRSVAWRVHAELGAMLVGGLSALLLQTLHPLVMQGVEDHSSYREDPFGRLRRTADFIALTTFAGERGARAAVQHVRRIHAGVRGTLPDGRSYRANDPALLRYVHVSEVWSFLRAYQRYSGQLLTLDEKNRYLEETSRVASEMGASAVPTTTEAVRAYLRDMRPQLSAGEPARRAVRFLMHPVGSGSLERAAHLTVVESAVDLLPRFAREELELGRPAVVRRLAVRPATTALSLGLRLALGQSQLVHVATARALAEPG